jgi:archaellum component FlaG (FlaF/FlaG flagellin family)
MADGGAFTIIMLVIALLISSAASAVLIQEWSSTSRVMQQQQNGLQLSEEIGIDFAGDPMMVSLEIDAAPGPLNEITFYVQNTGVHSMDESSLAIVVDGVTLPDTSITNLEFFPNTAVDWDPNVLLEIKMADSAFDAYGDSEEISIYVIARSDSISGISMTTEMVEEVQLHES